MVKTKSKARKGASAKVAKPAPSGSAADVPGLIDKAHVLLAQSNFDLAIKFLERALQLEPTNLEARELLGVAELEEGDGDKGREHLLHLFPPHTAEPPSSPSPYLYLAQSASEPQEALGYYSTAAAMIENRLNGKGKGKAADPAEVEEERRMAVTSLIAMIEIWMSDLCFEPEASNNCDALIARAVSVAPRDPEVLLTLASIRLSQSKFDEAKATILQVYSDLEGRDPFDPMLPGLPVRLTFARLLLEHHLHLEALDILSTVREEDSLEVEGAYLEGWAYHLRGEAVEADPKLLEAAADEEDKHLTAAENYAESMRALLEAAKLFTEQEYPDEGIGAHIQELLKNLETRGVQPAVNEEEGEDDAADEGGWEDVEGDGDVEMA